MFPIRDLSRAGRRAIMVPLLVMVNVLVFVHQLELGPAAGDRFVMLYGAVPRVLMHGRDLAALFTSMFLHGGFAHIIGNMWFLWIFGDNVEAAFGRFRFLLFYLLCGVGAAVAQVAMQPDSSVPMIGASGAIAGVMAAYVRLYPRARILTLVPIFIFIQFIELPAYVFIFIWFGYQLILSLASYGLDMSGGVAFFAHVGGFVTGLVLVFFFKPRRPVGLAP